ncbi:integrase core domain-containing protein [Streptomyces viridosporus]|uniref:Integrase catalytic domain-containing protein n=2 Tax=Streptomyces viridosporus TaxID=67581 RepID=A0ABX6ANA4_STRVD|nr:integrase core domain-containing protein [Streptomyces viridosporus]QEU89055.1 hypothetical protein CP969_03200 [Streptomyces viridosporus T7A]
MPRRCRREVFPVAPSPCSPGIAGSPPSGGGVHRTSTCPSGGQGARSAVGPGESAVGHRRIQGGADPARGSDRRLDGSGDPRRRGHRPGAASLRSGLARVPGRPDREGAGQRAWHLTAGPGRHIESLRFLARDRDGTCSAAFAAVFVAEGLRVILSAPRAPRMNAHCGRSVGGIRREMLDHVLIVGGAHARHVLAARQRHCNAHRPHRSRPLRRRDQVQWPLRE